jgi:hypothetical protein
MTRKSKILRALKELAELDSSSLASSSDVDDQELYLKLSRYYQSILNRGVK